MKNPIRGAARALFALALGWSATAAAAPIEIVHHGPQPSVVGQTIVVSTRFAVDGLPQPTGVVTISDGVDSCTATLPVATCAWTPSTPGPRTLTASYPGDGNFLASSDSETHVVEPVSLPERVSLGEPQLTYDYSNVGCCFRGSAFSADGRFVAFTSHYFLAAPDANGFRDVYLLDRNSGELSLVSVGQNDAASDGNSTEVAISRDGRYIAFTSEASNLVGGDSNGAGDVFLRDRIAGTTVRVSVTDDELQTPYASHEVDISADGQRVVFKSLGNLAANDVNADGVRADVFIRDVAANSTVLVSAGTGGTSLTGDSFTPSVSDDGNRVAFISTSALTASDANGALQDIFVRDVAGGSTELASVDDAELQAFVNTFAPVLSPDGTRVVFLSSSGWDASDSNGDPDCYVRDVQADTTTLASRRNDGTAGNDGATSCAFGGDDVWFTSSGTDLVALPDAPGSLDLFRRDLDGATTERITDAALDAMSSPFFAVSDDGRFASFIFNNGSAVAGTDSDLALYDDLTGATAGVKLDLRGNQSDTFAPVGLAGGASMSADGRFVAFVSRSANLHPYKTASVSEVFVRDRQLRITELVSRGTGGSSANGNSFAPAISADGRYVTFLSTASNLIASDPGGTQDVFHFDRDTQTLRRVSGVPGATEPDNHSHHPSISADGRYVAFESQASNLIASDTNNRKDIFRWDRDAPVLSAIERVSVTSSEVEADFDNEYASISGSGNLVAFESFAGNLDGPGGVIGQVYLRDIAAGTTTQISVGSGNTAPDGQSYEPALSSDGRYVAFGTQASNIAPAQPGINRVVRLDRNDGSVEAIKDAGGQPIEAGSSDTHANLSADGRYFALLTAEALESADVDLGIDLYVYDFETDRGRMVLGPGGAEPGIQSSRHSLALGANGAFLTAIADSTLLVPGDTNSVGDQFVFANPVFNLALEQQVVELTTQGNDASFAAASDASGRYVVFQSDAANLTGGDVNGASDIFRVDTATGAVRRLSLNDDESPLGADSIEPAISADGSAVLFVSADVGVRGVFAERSATTLKRGAGGGWSLLLRNLLTGTTQRLAAAQPSGSGTQPQIAPAANAVVFAAPNLDPMQGAVGQTEVFHLPLVRVGASLVPGTPQCVTCKSFGANGFPGPENSNGPSSAPVLSSGGDWVAWQTAATNTFTATPPPCPLVDTTILLRNLVTGFGQRISVPASPANCGDGDDAATQPSLDWSGRNVVFTTDQPLVPGDDNGLPDAYHFNLDQQRLVRVSVGPGGAQADGATTEAVISGDGSSVAFVSAATNLDAVEPDTNGFRDTHVTSLVGGAAAVRRLSRARSGVQANSHSQRPAWNYNGTQLAFDSDAGNLAPGAQAGELNVFQRANPLNADVVFGVGFE